MGCAQSRIDNEEAVARCRDRRQRMKAAAAARNELAAAHSAYALALKNTGAALSEFAHAEEGVPPPLSADGAGPADVPAPAPAAGGIAGGRDIDPLPPPPPPLPVYTPPPAKIHRSVSLPTQIAPAKRTLPPSPLGGNAITEEDEGLVEEEEEEEERLDHRRRYRRRSRSQKEEEEEEPSPAVPPPPPPEAAADPAWDYFFFTNESQMPSLAPEEEDGRIQEEEDIYPDAEPYTPPPPPRPLALSEDDDADEVFEDPITPGSAQPEMPRTPPPLQQPGRKQKQKQKAAAVHHQHTASAPINVGTAAAAKAVAAAPAREAPYVNLVKVMEQIDDQFLRASESASEVSKVLEANRMHYHSNFADNRGHIDHSARVMKIITWNRSFKGLNNGEDGQDDFDNDEFETLATVIDKMLAWEKKLYDEVKSGELMKMEYQRKVSLLNKQKRSGTAVEILEKTKAAVSHLHTKYIVDMQSMDSTVSEIQNLRDYQLYPRLVNLADRMAGMWEAMHMHHQNQLSIVSNLKSLEGFHSAIETSDHHHRRTLQLCSVVKEWSMQFCSFMNSQKEYVGSLNGWLKLNLIPIECSLKEKPTSPPRVQDPPIKALLQSWNEQLERLSDDFARSAILSFVAVLDTISTLQKEEIKQKEKCEETEREYRRKCRAFDDWYQKYMHRKAGASDELESGEGTGAKDVVAERKFVVDSWKSRLDEESDAHSRLSKQVREKSFTVLKTHLPELFRAICDFARASSALYSNLRLSSLMQGPEGA